MNNTNALLATTIVGVALTLASLGGNAAAFAAGPDFQAPRSEDTERPRGQGAERPRNQDLQAPRGEFRARQGQDAERPRGEDERPRRQER